MYQHLARLSLPGHVQQDALVDCGMVPESMRRVLVEPARLAVIGAPRKDALGPEVLTRALLVVPRTRVGRAVVQQVELGIVGNPAPHGAAADFQWPGGHSLTPRSLPT